MTDAWGIVLEGKKHLEPAKLLMENNIEGKYGLCPKQTGNGSRTAPIPFREFPCWEFLLFDSL